MRKNRWWIGVGAGLFGVSLLFQNCTSQKSSQTESESKSTSPIAGQPPVTRYGGDGVDGKTYAHLGTCAAEIAVDTRIFVSNDLSIAYVVKENCKEVDGPYANRISEVAVQDDRSAMIVFASQNLVLDIEPVRSEALPKSILVSCSGDYSSPGVAVTVWKDATGVYGQAVDQAVRPAADTGTVPLISETTGEYFGQNGAAQFTLLMNTETAGTVMFNPTNGGNAKTSNVVCAVLPADGNSVTDRPADTTVQTNKLIESIVPPVAQRDPACGEVVQTSNSRQFNVNFAAGAGNGDCIIQVRKSIGTTTPWIDIMRVSCDQDLSSSQTLLLPETGLGFWAGSMSVRLIRAADQIEMCDFDGALLCAPMSASPVSTPTIDENCNGRWDEMTPSGKYN